ncbi:B-cell receptor CD22-like [Salvelinus alpinus]
MTLSDDPDYKGCVTYRSDKKNGDTLTIRDLSLQLKRTGGNMVNGHYLVKLTCSTTCTLTDNPTYIWYKNVQPVQEDSSSMYSISNKPKTTVSVSPSGEIVEGSSVTLTCSSDANPPVDKYTWYKKNVTSPKASGQSYSITNINSEDRGEYYCEAENTYGLLNSSSVFVDVQCLQVKVTGGHQDKTLTCSTTCTLTDNPTYIWYKNGHKVKEGTSSLYSDSFNDADSYSCAVKGHEDLPAPAVYGPKNTSVSVSPSGEIVEGSSVTLTCSSDANPPVDKYTWYKTKYKNMSMRHSGQRYTIHNISSEDREGYYCEALNIIGRETIPVHINVISVFPWVPVVGVGAVLTAGALLVTIYCYMKRRSTGGSDAMADTQIKGLPCDTAPQKDAEPSDYENWREPPQNLDSDTASQVDAEPSDYENWSEPPQNLDCDTASQVDAEPSDYENWSEPPQNLD